MRHRNNFIAITTAFLLISLFSSCEREVHLNLNTGPARLVVEGRIDNGFPPFVILTNSIGFFSNVDFSTVQNAFVHNADVTVSDGIKTVKLREYSLDTANKSKFYVYSIDTADPGSFTFLGQVGKSYTLTINYDGKTYVATTKIPVPITIDSVRSQPPTFSNDKYPDAVQLVVYFKDPDTLGNYCKYFTKQNSESFYSGDLYSDQITNGIPVNWHISPGYNKVEPDSVKHFFFYKGDTVTVAWSSIDKGVYNFWNTFAFAVSATGNPFASPLNSQSNISNGAVGVWAGYGSDTITYIVPK